MLQTPLTACLPGSALAVPPGYLHAFILHCHQHAVGCPQLNMFHFPNIHSLNDGFTYRNHFGWGIHPLRPLLIEVSVCRNLIKEARLNTILNTKFAQFFTGLQRSAPSEVKEPQTELQRKAESLQAETQAAVSKVLPSGVPRPGELSNLGYW